MATQHQPTPESIRYTDLISEIENGRIKIPKFQRNFVWSLDNTAKLLDSILKGYPIGTFILWKTRERLNDITNIGNLELPPIPQGDTVQYVLDGQQRITSLYAAFLGAKIQKEGERRTTNYSEIYVDLDGDIKDNDNQVVVSEKPEGKSITLHKILNFTDNLLSIKKKYTDEQFTRILEYSQAFSTYTFSTVVLRREDIDSAIEVFTRINTGGQTLTLFEIMSAKTYDEKQQFDMEEKFQILIKELDDVGYETISSSVILYTLSLILSKNKECKRKVILQLNKQDIIDIWDSVILSIKSTIDYFRSVYRIPVSALLPYDSLLVPFAYFFYHKKDNPGREQIKFLEEFFWRISLSSRYSSSTESKLAQDIKRIDKILNNERPNYDDVKVYLDSPEDLIGIGFSTGSSYCKAILCLLAYHEPKDFQNNGKIILDNSWLKVASSKNYHHFFPKAYLKKSNIENENSIVNITLVSDRLNKSKIRAKAPSLYTREFLDENSEFLSSIKSHLIDDLQSFGIESDNYKIFLKKRSEVIYRELKNRIELGHKESQKEEEIKSIILKGENESLEFKSTLRYDLKEGAVNKKLEYVVAKTISAFLNTEGGQLIIGVDDNGNTLGLDKDIQTLTKKDIDGFELHLRRIIKKYLKKDFEKHVKVLFPVIDDKEICLINISKSSEPVFVSDSGEENFYVRNGNSSIPKTRQEQSEYQNSHWG